MSSEKLHPHLPYNKKLNEKARELRNNLTPAEKLFWYALRRMPFYQNKQFQFNRQKPIGNYIADFYCHRIRLVIEIDGDTHGEDKNAIKDSRRTALFESQDLKVLRFSNQEVEKNIDGVMTRVEKFLGFPSANPPDPLCKGEQG